MGFWHHVREGGEVKIHECITDGDIEGIKKELRRGAKVEALNDQKMTPLAVAAKSPAAGVEILRLLIEAGANVNVPVDDKKTFPVGLAADSCDLAKLRCLLDAGADANAASHEGYTPIINVLYHLQDNDKIIPVLDLLIKFGANIDAVTSYGESPITTAAMQARFDVVKYLIAAGAKTDRLNWTPEMLAVCLGTVDDLRHVLNDNGDLESRDYFGRTAWLLAAEVGEVQKAEFLLALGTDLEERGRTGETALANCIARGHVVMTRWLIEAGADVNNADDSGNTPLMVAARSGQDKCVQLLLDAGGDPGLKNAYNETALSVASSEKVIRQLLKRGADLADINKEMRRLLTHMGGSEKLEVTRQQYLSGRYPRFGRSNPEEMNIPFWREMVRTGINAYQGKMQFDDSNNYTKPVWCFDRFGTSFTEIPDGRIVQIAGEHEDYYDPDFYIYNDVFVHDPSGTFQIFGYPREVFPPTDFHSATYCNGFIYIIGGLGYHGERHFGTTPVYRLNCKTWKIDKIATSGECPGWIFKHEATLTDGEVLTISGGTKCVEVDGEEQNIENEAVFQFNLSNMRWSRC